MTGSPPEFSRAYPLESIWHEARAVDLVATPEECAALAARFGLAGISKLSATAALKVTSDYIEAKGRLKAAVSQCCVATGVPVPAKIDEAFSIRFVASNTGPQPDEIEIDADDCDVVEHDGQAIDLGEAVAQSLALALDPFPRAADAGAVLKQAGVIDEDEVVSGAFAGLKGLFKPN